MREIVLDTETTGLNALTGDRLVEIGCVELDNGIPTGRNWHFYFNPERDMPAEAEAVHGLSAAFLADKPRFAELADEFLAFVDGARLVIHNAEFDIGFLNMELRRCGRQPLDAANVVDTLALARRRHPGGGNRLDDLCQRYGIDNSRRTKHGALLDCELLAEVYIELNGGRQAGLALVAHERREIGGGIRAPEARPAPLPERVSEIERAAHEAFVATLGENAIWRRYAD
ncbi:MAG: DNA polymerase III subunit epsilon [Flavobacteriaceae bacterium]